ncbi:MAG: alpha/beta hydrolase, partial [Stackebrandtia sp.]
MVTYEELRDAKPETLRTLADDWGKVVTEFDDASEQLGVNVTAPLQGGEYEGRSIDAAFGRSADLCGHVDAGVAEATGMQRVVGELAEGIEDIRGRLRSLESAIRQAPGMTIQDDGKVVYTVSDSRLADKTGFDECVDAASEYSNQIRDLVDEADALDKEILDKLPFVAGEEGDVAFNADAAAALDSLDLQVDVEAIPDGEGDSPAGVKQWWDSLSRAEQLAYLRAAPETLGGLDGIPALDRDQANRAVLSQLTGDIGLEIYRSDPERYEAHPEQLLDAVELQLKARGLDVLQDRLDQPGYLLLGFDPANDGQAIVATGDPDAADNVLTYVPGTETDLANLEIDLDRTDKMVADASSLDPGADTVGVMWLGYDAPDHPIVDAPAEGYAEAAADPLSDFQEGLRTTHAEGGSHNTVLGHSYGSTVIGHAAQTDGGMDVDNMVFVGSPGVDVHYAEALGIEPGSVFATTAESDPIREPADMPFVHGPNPATETFHGQIFDSDPRGGHADYWDDGNVARDNIARIVTGNLGDVTYTPGE